MSPYPLVPRDRVRELFLANGFTIKVGQPDLKGYVFDAALALEREVHGLALKTDETLLRQALEALLDGPDPDTGKFTPEYAAAINALEERLHPHSGIVMVQCHCGDTFGTADGKITDDTNKCLVCGEGPCEAAAEAVAP